MASSYLQNRADISQVRRRQHNSSELEGKKVKHRVLNFIIIAKVAFSFRSNAAA